MRQPLEIIALLHLAAVAPDKPRIDGRIHIVVGYPMAIAIAHIPASRYGLLATHASGTLLKLSLRSLAICFSNDLIFLSRIASAAAIAAGKSVNTSRPRRNE